MKETDASEYQACIYDKAGFFAPGKVGKTCWLVAAALGVLPNQLKSGTGGIVGKPEFLHVIAIDSSAMSDVMEFLITCGAPKEVLKVRIYNMQDDVNRLAAGDNDYDMSFYNSMAVTNQKIRARVAGNPGTHAVICSSLTGLASAIERGVAGPPGSAGMKNKDGEMSGKGYMDPSKWQAHAQQLAQLRSIFQVDDFHMLWEGHIDVVKKFAMKKEDSGVTEQVAISGKTGRNWGWNTDHTYRLRRTFGDTWDGTPCDKTYMDTDPDMEFFPGGRGQKKLKKREFDLSIVYKKLGLKRGGWGRKKESKVSEG